MPKTEPTTLINLTFKLRRDRAWLLQRIGRHIEMARDAGLEVCIGAEDASRADTDFLARIAEAAQNAGARRIRFADTLGLLDPFAVAERIGISCGEIPISKSKCMRTTISDWPQPTLWPQSVPGRHTLIPRSMVANRPPSTPIHHGGQGGAVGYNWQDGTTHQLEAQRFAEQRGQQRDDP